MFYLLFFFSCSGDLTEKGFKIKKYRLWKKFIQTNYTIKIPNSSLEKKMNGSLNSNPKITATLNHPSPNPDFAEKEFQPYRPERRHLLSFPDDFLQPGVFPWEKSNGLIFKLQKVSALNFFFFLRVNSGLSQKIITPIICVQNCRFLCYLCCRFPIWINQLIIQFFLFF